MRHKFWFCRSTYLVLFSILCMQVGFIANLKHERMHKILSQVRPKA